MMMTTGNRRIYDDFQMGCVANPADKSEIMLTFKEKDNDVIHMFQTTPEAFEQFVNLVRQTIAGQKIEIPTLQDVSRHGK